jgi:hypothetical protein
MKKICLNSLILSREEIINYQKFHLSHKKKSNSHLLVRNPITSSWIIFCQPKLNSFLNRRARNPKENHFFRNNEANSFGLKINSIEPLIKNTNQLNMYTSLSRTS